MTTMPAVAQAATPVAAPAGDRLTVRVRALHDETAEIRRFVLESADGALLPPATPGSHVDVHLRGAATVTAGAAPAASIMRQYSLCNGPDDRDVYVLAVKREPHSRGGSAAMHRLAVGDRLEIGRPRNNFPLAAGAAHHLLLAGGIGVTPLLAMARHLAGDGGAFALHHFVRGPEHAAFGDLFAGALAPRAHVHAGLDAVATQARLAALVADRGDGAHLYVCGPELFMAAAIGAALANGWPDAGIHREYFGAAPTVGAGAGFEVVLAASGGVSVRVAADETIVAALARIGVVVEVSCEQGICGTCLTRVIEGVPDHRDVFLTEAEQRAGDRMCLCVSRAASNRLVIDR
ncbi:PDR/VanB family oxidoreductase [Pseudoxanthobacter sp. M-2]|uniref:PDR/VanB family oxidoreductase n=1 Tax=Pseudoxanthobacter sp. M-2 TaxID=3078754 RepID=UPI0038FD2DAF